MSISLSGIRFICRYTVAISTPEDKIFRRLMVSRSDFSNVKTLFVDPYSKRKTNVVANRILPDRLFQEKPKSHE